MPSFVASSASQSFSGSLAPSPCFTLTLQMFAHACACMCVCVCVCVSVSISPWQHSSKTEPVRGLCLTSLFNQTQTHTSGQPGPRYLSLPPSARCTHPALSFFCSLLLLFQHSFPVSPLSLLLAFPPHSSFLSVSVFVCVEGSFPLRFSTPVHHIVSRLFIFLHFLCPAPCAPYTPAPFLPCFSGLLWAPLSPRDVTLSTDSGAAANKLGQNWLKMLWRPCTSLTVTYSTRLLSADR